MRHTVIGGGLAGLTAATELARRGATVRLIEKHRELGGRAATTEKDGFSLNLGPHAVYLKGTAYRTLTDWGVMPAGGQPQLANGAAMVLDGKRYPFVADLKSLLTCGFLSARERFEAVRLFRKLFNPASARDAEGMTMDQWLDRHVLSANVRFLAEGLVRLGTYSPPHVVAASAALQQLQLGGGGVIYVHHGWRSLIRNMADYARSLGVTIETGAAAAGEGILAVNPHETERLTGRSLGALTPVRMASLDIALEAVPDGAAPFGLGLDEPLYFSMHSEWARLALPGKALVHVAKYLGPERSADAVEDRAQLESFADLLMPGWRERVHYARFLPDLIVTHAAVGLTPRPDVDALEGVRIAGDWVGPEGMLADAAVASGLRAARSLFA